MGNTVRGIDVSAWQHLPGWVPIDWHAVAKDGVGFVIIKATQGLDYVNPWLSEDAFGAHAAGLAIGYYHFAVPNEGDAELQAHFALTAMEGLPRTLGMALDIEEDGSLPHFQVPEWCQAFAKVVVDQHHYCPIYTGGNFGETLTGLPWGQRLWWATPEVPPQFHAYMTQGQALGIDGIPSVADTDLLYLPRGINPTSPGEAAAQVAPSPTAAAAPAAGAGSPDGEASSTPAVPGSSVPLAAQESAPEQG